MCICRFESGFLSTVSVSGSFFLNSRSSHFPEHWQSKLLVGAQKYNSRITALGSRRHHRRRQWDSDWEPSILNKKGIRSAEQRSEPYKIDDRVVVTIDLQKLRSDAKQAVNQASNAVQSTLQSVRKAGRELADDTVQTWRELCSSVAVQNNGRIVFAVRRSTINFIGILASWTLVIFVLGKILLASARKFRWGWEETLGKYPIVKRDRSLGGKEVIVGGKHNHRSIGTIQKYTRMPNPLDGLLPSRSEKGIANIELSRGVTPQETKLPNWWPSPDPPPSVAAFMKTKAQNEANSLLKALMQKRLIGTDYSEQEILQLRRICRTSGVNVTFDTASTRDSFFRTAINFTLSFCSRADPLAPVRYGGENPDHFIAGLATNVGLNPQRASVMVDAAVAARTRSSFLQAWAFHVQGKDKEAEGEILKLVRIHTIFTPDPKAPQMEMVARGLESPLSTDQRTALLEMYTKYAYSSLRRVAVEALGLVSLEIA